MASIPGLTFSPLAQQGGPNGEGNAAPSVQEAIRTLSYKIPRTVGAASPIPQALLSAPGGAGVSRPGSMGGAPSAGPMGQAPGAPTLGFEELLRKLFGLGAPEQMAGQMSGQMAPQGLAPAPRFTPGYADQNAQVGPPIMPQAPVKTGRVPDEGGALGGAIGGQEDLASNPMKQKFGLGGQEDVAVNPMKQKGGFGF